MAWYDDDEFGDYEVIEPGETPSLDSVLWDNFSGDDRAQELFHDAFFEDNEKAYQDLIDYLWDVYGIDFEDAFDWEDFRSWYDAA